MFIRERFKPLKEEENSRCEDGRMWCWAGGAKHKEIVFKKARGYGDVSPETTSFLKMLAGNYV